MLPKLQICMRGLRVLLRPPYLVLVAGTTIILLGLYLYIPVWLVPGNSLALELAEARALPYALLVLLALFGGMLFSLELFSFRRARQLRLASTSETSGGIVASLVGGVLAAASCGCGTGILLGVLGLGGNALFVAAHQTLIVLVMLCFVAIGLYFSARRAAGVCAI